MEDKKYFIPIIGSISAGKSTFLNAFLGTNVLQTGETTTTKFICLIKNSKRTSFYHIIPKKDKELFFVKEGEEVKGEDDIKKKIEEINISLSDIKGTQNEIFYILETPIKNVDNISLLNECYFMDIPGLNENNSSYIENIFSLISTNDILFEIIIFDTTSFQSDSILNIFRKLKEKNCLKKQNNIFILNKIDSCKNEENTIDRFKQYFYKTFEDEKNENNYNNYQIFINIYENHFIPMNSLLLMAENRINDDFSFLLLFELFNYLDSKNKEDMSFFEFLKKNIDLLIENLDLEFEDKINDEDMIIVENSINFLKKKLVNIQNSDFEIGINLNKKNIKKEMQKIYNIHKNKKYFVIHSKYYNQFQEIIKNIKIKFIDLPSPQSAISIKSPFNENFKDDDPLNKDNIIRRNSSVNVDISTIEEIDNFLNETFKLINLKNNETEVFRVSLQSLRENILGRKLRISFIGNINVGKSSVLNCIIGKNILPTNEIECTYRGVIIRHKDIKEYKLYKANLITRGEGIDQYYYFEIDQNPYCEGVNEIKSFLKNKNNDRIMSDLDAFIVIEGRLKIFDYIKLKEEVINTIEFIDLPGLDRDENYFKKEYYQKVLRFTNSCIYINEPRSIDDSNSLENMKKQYSTDKGKVLPNLRAEFIKTCLFLINKSDSITNISDKDVSLSYKNKIFNQIKSIENKNNLNIDDMNISFFSAKKVNYFMEIYYKYVEKLENSPFEVVYKFFDEYHNTKFKFKDFKNHILSALTKIEEHLDLDDEEYEIPEQFKNKLKAAFNNLYNDSYIKLKKIEEDEIIQKLYILNQQLKSKDFSKTEYSLSFFNILEKAIKNCENLKKANLNDSLKKFFENSDLLFQIELEEEGKKEKLNHKRKLENIYNELIPNAVVFLSSTEQNLKNYIENGKNKCIKLIKEEIDNIAEKLKDSNKDISIAKKNLERKIENIIEEVRIKQKEEIESLIKVLQELFEKKLKISDEKEYSSTKIHTNRGLTSKMIASTLISTISGAAVRTGLTFVGEAILAGGLGGIGSTTFGSTAAGIIAGPVGIAIGFGVGLTISISTLLYSLLKKEKRYKKGLEKFKKDIADLFDDAEKSCLEDFLLYKITFLKEIAKKIAIINIDITNVDSKKWETIKNNYNEKRNKIMKKIKTIKI